MKRINIILTAALTILMTGACADLNVKPLSEASSANWYQNAEQITFSLNDLYRTYPYGIENEYWTDRRTDDWAQRDQVYDLCNGSTTSATGTYNTFWLNSYKAISRAIRVIESIDRLGNPAEFQTLKAEALFFRAYFYGRLVNLWGDVPFYTETITKEEAYEMGRIDKNIVAAQVYNDFDDAIEGLPVNNNNDNIWRVNKGTALAMKARFALQRGDYAECAARCKDLMDLKAYSLYYSAENPADSYGELFRDKTINCEIIWAIGRSIALDPDNTQAIKSWVPRSAGGNNTAQPSWDLLAAYECTDGKTINESPLFDPHKPFDNRDPRCCMTFVKPGTSIYGVVFDPSINTTEVYDEQAGKMVTNKDSKAKDVYAPYNGCCLRKGAQPEWRTAQKNENPIVLCRYADILLMYAEAKMELNDIDASVLNAINDVRARAYGVTRNETGSYPAVTTTDQASLRKIIRRERRVELAWEGTRFFDLRRWGLLEKCYSTHYYGFRNKTDQTEYESKGFYFWPETPVLDEDGFADFEAIYNKTFKNSSDKDIRYIERYGFHKYDPKVELFPIPDDDIIASKGKILQNPGY